MFCCPDLRIVHFEVVNNKCKCFGTLCADSMRVSREPALSLSGSVALMLLPKAWERQRSREPHFHFILLTRGPGHAFCIQSSPQPSRLELRLPFSLSWGFFPSLSFCLSHGSSKVRGHSCRTLILTGVLWSPGVAGVVACASGGEAHLAMPRAYYQKLFLVALRVSYRMLGG